MRKQKFKVLCVDYAIHDTGKGNPHCHIMLTMRPLDERGAWAAKSQKEYDLDENGERIRLPSGRYKTHKVDLTGWNDKGNALLWRKAWADLTNDFLERNGSPQRIDHRSNAERGIDEIPTVHMGVAACQMEKKAFNFCYRGEGERLFVFEAPVDLLSFLCLFKKEWQKQSYLSLGGVGEKALLRFLSDRPNIKTVYLCLDSDEAGNDACSRLVKLMPEGYTVHRLIPLFKDWNEVLQHRAEITDGKYLREAIYGLKEPPQEETVEIIRMSEVDTQTVEWLWEPYIPFGKVTIVQGNPGEGKTTFALRLAAACTNRKPFPHMAAHEPFNVIYQTAEDGLGDTIKPRLMEAEADLDRVLVIDESKQGLSLSDERIERAIRQTRARLIILDPIQAYVGEKTDMNKANEIRPMFRRLADIAERTGCAVILIGHLNKAAGGQSAYRGLGSIDFRAAARSVLLIGRVKREPNVRVIVHDKSSLAPEGKPIAFCLDPETGFSWIGEYDITADELLSGAGGNTATKTEQAERLILDLLADGKELASEDIVKAAAEAGISERTVQNAKRNMGGILGARRVGGQWYNFIKKKQPPEPAS